MSLNSSLPGPPSPETRQDLLDQIRQLKPWHQNIRLTEDLQVMDAFSQEEQQRENNQNISLHDLQASFEKKVGKIYPNGLHGKRFLDCACNAGAYCFWALEMGAEAAFGFDVRDHWINQANFIRQYRNLTSQDRVRFETRDLMTLPEIDLDPADFTLFKGIFYHLADPILGLKIAAELTREVIWLNTARCFIDNSESLYCTFEGTEQLMSGVHSLSWIPSGPSVIGKMLYWLGFEQIVHVFSKQYEDRPKFGRMELVASRTPGMLDQLVESEKAETVDVAGFRNSRQASDAIKELF